MFIIIKSVLYLYYKHHFLNKCYKSSQVTAGKNLQVENKYYRVINNKQYIAII